MPDTRAANRAIEGQLWKAGSPRRRSIQLKQLRRLHALWHRWTKKLGLKPEADRQLRHYYIWIITRGQTTETKELTEPLAALVITWLAKLARLAEARQNYAAGTAGREGYPEQRQVPPSSAAWRALWGCAAALGMGRSELNSFISGHYRGVGLRSLADVRSMADVNRVLWGLKAMLRRRSATNCFGHAEKRAA